jgi:pimeloyl-ACP methyl ester carboxylesterase
MNTTNEEREVGAPPLRLLALEPWRAALEYAGMHLMDKRSLPPGDGHPVVIFPGLATDARATAPLRELCEQLGYTAFDWGRGFNTGPQGDIDEWIDRLKADVTTLLRGHDSPASLVGWSLGGIYARELAKRMPRRVRQVITIGTPFAGEPSQTHVGGLYRLLNGQPPGFDEALKARLRTPPPVPTTSIYSRNDGIVAWQTCVDDSDQPGVENVEIAGSHCGMGWNPEVLAAVAQRLARQH